jgi:hypothetical protein
MWYVSHKLGYVKNIVSYKSEISGFIVCSSARECVHFDIYCRRAALLSLMKGWKTIVLKAVVYLKQQILEGVVRQMSFPCNPLLVSRSIVVHCTVSTVAGGPLAFGSVWFCPGCGNKETSRMRPLLCCQTDAGYYHVGKLKS